MKSNESTNLPQTIPYHVAEHLRRGIIRGRYAPGANLRELDLRADFGSSRGPVREGLRLLELQGLVVHSPRRGFRVKAHTEAEIRSIYELRSLLESKAIEALARLDVRPLVDRLRRSNQRMKACVQGRLLDDYFDENVRFHQSIIDYTQDLPLIKVLSLLNEMALPIRYLLIAERFPRGMVRYDYHDQIVSSIATHNFARARKLTAKHVLSNVNGAIRSYRRLSEGGKTDATAKSKSSRRARALDGA